jgi:hypothetical protein
MIAAHLDAHARAILARELERRNRALGSLPATSRAAVLEAAERTVAALTEAIVQVAAEEPAVAAAMRSVYAAYGATDAAAAGAASD